MRRPRNYLRPLTVERLAVLVAIAQGEQSASEIQQQLIGDSVGAIYMRSSSLYYVLHLAVETGLAVENQGYYSLSDEGHEVLERQLTTMENLVRAGRAGLRESVFYWHR